MSRKSSNGIASYGKPDKNEKRLENVYVWYLNQKSTDRAEQEKTAFKRLRCSY